jgi:uncharacterized Ntn-hydrolase superfamily protein
MHQEDGERRRQDDYLGVHRVLLCGAVSFAVSSWSGGAGATYSIAAVDSLARTMGAAGTSCLGGEDVAVIHKSAPGVGVVLGQAQYNANTHQRALELLAGGMTPEAVIADVTSPEVDVLASVRQYAIVDASGRVAAFTGSGTGEWSGDEQGQVSGRFFSVQGNMLTGEDVVRNAATSFQKASCDLAEQLLTALEAGARNGQGDQRCTPALPSDSAFLSVESLDTRERIVDLRVPSSGSENPLLSLRTQLEEYRAAHPCATSPGTHDSERGGCSLGGRCTHSGWLLAVVALVATLRRPWRSTT